MVIKMIKKIRAQDHGDEDDQKFCAYKIMVINEWKDRKQTSRGLEEARLPHNTVTVYNTSQFNTG